LGGTKGIWSVTILSGGVLAWLSVWCRLACGPADGTATHSLASVKSRLVLPFWYRLAWVVPDKEPLIKQACIIITTVIIIIIIIIIDLQS